jgi:hypothetical protein
MGLGSKIRGPKKTYYGCRSQKGTGSRIRNTENYPLFMIKKGESHEKTILLKA